MIIFKKNSSVVQCRHQRCNGVDAGVVLNGVDTSDDTRYSSTALPPALNKIYVKFDNFCFFGGYIHCMEKISKIFQKCFKNFSNPNFFF